MGAGVVPGDRAGDRVGSSYQEGAAGQEIQEPGAANHATAGQTATSQHRTAKAVLLLQWGQAR